MSDEKNWYSTPEGLEMTFEHRRRIRRFVLWRKEDHTGVSGTGIVAQGVMFTDGRVSLRWISDHASTSNFDSIDDVRAIHGHDGATVVDWMDAGT